MSPPIRDGSGSSIGSIRLGDGSEISEVRTGAGDVLFSAGPPDSGVALYDARSLTGFSDGDSASTWTATIGSDLSGAATYRASGIAGQASLDHNGSSDGFDTSFGSTISQPFVVYSVINPNTTELPIGTSGDPVRSFWAEPNTNSPNGSWNGNIPAWELFAGKPIRGSSTKDRRIISCLADGANSILREDNTQTASGDAGTLGLDLFSIGKSNDPAERFWPGDIGYVEVHESVPNSGFESREQDIIDDWGLSV